MFYRGRRGEGSTASPFSHCLPFHYRGGVGGGRRRGRRGNAQPVTATLPPTSLPFSFLLSSLSHLPFGRSSAVSMHGGGGGRGREGGWGRGDVWGIVNGWPVS